MKTNLRKKRKKGFFYCSELRSDYSIKKTTLTVKKKSIGDNSNDFCGVFYEFFFLRLLLLFFRFYSNNLDFICRNERAL